MNTILFVGSLFLAVIVAGAVAYLSNSFEDRTTQQLAIEAGVLGGLVGFANYTAPAFAGEWQALFWLPLLALIVAMGYLTWRWHNDGSNIREFIAYMIAMFFTRNTAAVVAMCSSEPLVRVLPDVFYVLCVGLSILSVFIYMTEERGASENWRLAGIGLMFLAVATSLYTVSVAMRDGNYQPPGRELATFGQEVQTMAEVTEPEAEAAEGAETEVAEADAAEAETGDTSSGMLVATTDDSVAAMAALEAASAEPWYWYHFYNGDLDHEDKEVFQNFGPDPMLETAALDGVGDLLKEAGTKGTIKVEDIIDRIDVSAIDADFRERMSKDPALGAADMAWFDSIMGTRYIGVFYDECEKQWDAAINNAKSYYMEHPETYEETLQSFFDYLDMNVEMVVRKDKGLTDQMYMNPFTPIPDVPDVICLESEDHEGWFIVYKFTIKGTTEKEVKYRINCGYQPTNVAKVMGLKPGKNPNKRTSVVGGSGGGGKGGSGGGKKNALSNPKDPTKGTVVLPNDNRGPGENTNNGVGAQYSRVDQSTSSNHLTQEQYWENMEDKGKDWRGGGDSNAPTVSTPTDAVSDNNGSSGNSVTNTPTIDKPREVTAPAETSGGGVAGKTGNTDSVGDDAWADDNWGGPPL